MSCLPPMTGNGNHTTYKNGDDANDIVLPTLQHVGLHPWMKLQHPPGAPANREPKGRQRPTWGVATGKPG